MERRVGEALRLLVLFGRRLGGGLDEFRLRALLLLEALTGLQVFDRWHVFLSHGESGGPLAAPAI